MTGAATVVFLRNGAQPAFLSRRHPELLKRSRLISLDLEVSQQLERWGLPYEELQQWITVSRLHELREEAYHLRDTWYRPLAASCAPEYFSVIHGDRCAWTYAFRDMLVAREIFARAVDRTTRQILVFDGGQRPGVWESESDVADALWRHLADRAGVDVRIIQCPGSQHGLSRLAGFFAALTRRLRARATGFRRPRAPRDPPPRGVLLVVVAPGELDRYAPICERLRAALGDRFLPVTNGCGQRVGEVHYHSVADLLGRNGSARPAGALLPACEDLALASAYPEIFRNPHLRFHFDHFFGVRWPHLYATAAALPDLLQAIRPFCVAVTDMPYGYQDLFVRAARQLGLPTLSLPHSATPSPERFRLQADLAITWTDDYRMVFEQEGLDASRVLVVGVPASMLFKAYAHPIRTPRGGRRGSSRTILVLSAMTKLGLLPPLDLSAYLSTLHALLQIPEDLRGSLQIVWKCHPAFDHPAILSALVRRYSRAGDVRLYTDGLLEDYVLEADLAVLTIPTSVYLAPLFLDRPLVYLHTSGWQRETFYLAGWKGESVVSDERDIWPTLRRALFDPDFRAALRQDNRRVVEGLRTRLLSDEQAAAEILRAAESLARPRGNALDPSR